MSNDTDLEVKIHYSRLRLLQEAFHGFDLLEVAGHVSGQHHLHY